MRTKSCAHHIPTVIDLTYNPEQQQEPSPPPISSGNQQPQLKPSIDVKKDVKPVREKNTAAKVRKAACGITGKKPSMKRKRTHRQEDAAVPAVQQQHPTGLYQFDLTEMIRQKLKMLFEPSMLAAAHGGSSSFIPYDARYGWGPGARQPAANVMRLTPSYQPCSVPGCSQEALSASLARHHCGRPSRTVAQPGRRFSIFRSVELMAQSSCVSKH